jgi:hypothetical protein
LKSNSPGEDQQADQRQRWLLGLGLDGKDGHVRYTRGPNFRLVGGSEDTHDEMQEKVIHFNEELTRREKSLDDLTRPEFEDIARETGLKQD